MARSGTRWSWRCGNHLTNDLAIGLRLPFESAEEVKLNHGQALSANVRAEENITVMSFGGEARQQVFRREIANILEARAEEILSMINKEIKRSGYDGLLPAGVVLSGGTVQLPGIRGLGRQVLGLPVRLGKPRNLLGLIDAIDNPAHAVGAGLMMWGSTEEARPQLRAKPGPARRGRFLDWLRAFLPG